MRESDSLESRIAKARQDVDELKLKQIVGNSSVKIIETTTDNTWDIDQVYTSSNFMAGFWFTADNQIGPFVAFRPSILIDGAAWELTSNKLYEVEVTTPWFFLMTNEKLNRTAYTQYVISLNGAETAHIQIKMRALANDTGTLESTYQ